QVQRHPRHSVVGGGTPDRHAAIAGDHDACGRPPHVDPARRNRAYSFRKFAGRTDSQEQPDTRATPARGIGQGTRPDPARPVRPGPVGGPQKKETDSTPRTLDLGKASAFPAKATKAHRGLYNGPDWIKDDSASHGPNWRSGRDSACNSRSARAEYPARP